MLKKTAGLLISLLILSVIATYVSPGTVYRGLVSLERSRGELERKAVTIDDHTIVYLEGGEGEAVLLIHGFNGNKDNWTRFARFLTGKYRVIAIDNAGFGESTFKNSGDYAMKAQAARILKFADSLGLKKFHVAGNSMGGAISGFIALSNPARLLSLGLINAAGIKSAKKSEFQLAVEKGKNPLVVQNAGEYKKLMDFVFTEPPFIPSPLVYYMGEENLKRTGQNEFIFSQIRNEIGGLEEKLDKIATRTLILWGDNDRVLDVSGAKIFHQKIKNSKLVIMKNCGHIPMIERPEEAAGHYLLFLEDRG